MIKSESRLRALAMFEKVLEAEEATGSEIFFDYSPHINGFAVNAYPDGWEEGTRGIYIGGRCTNNLVDTQYTKKQYEKVLDGLEKYVEEHRKEEEE